MEVNKSNHEKKDLAINYITNRVPIIPDSYNVNQTHRFINKNIKNFETIDYIYIVDRKKNLVGIISIKEIFRHSPKTKIKDIMFKNIVSVSPNAGNQRVADLALKHGIKAIPIVENGKMLGVILTNKILSILNRSLHRNILYFAGIHKGHLDYENTMQVPLPLTLLHRIPWLVVGLIGVLFIAAFIDKYESILNQNLILAFFIPAIVYMSNALGTQHQTLFIRDLALFGKELNLVKYFLKQMLISLIIGAFIGGTTFLVVSYFWQQPKVSFVISLAMFATLVISSFISLLTAYLFKTFGQDPALGSGPFATIISDSSSIVIYFVIVSLMI